MDEYSKRVEKIRENVMKTAVEKFGSLYKASVAIGKTRAYFYGNNKIKTLDSLISLCNAMDKSVFFFLSGEDGTSSENKGVRISNIIKAHNRYSKESDMTLCNRVVISKLKLGITKNITIKSILFLADKYKISVRELLTGDK